MIYEATLDPSKDELLRSHLDAQPWGGDGDIERIGAYRFDDPEGEVGIEGHLVRRGTRTLHVALTYRAAPLVGADAHLVGVTDHSVLGRRWVYEASADPVAGDAFVRFAHGEGRQAALEVHAADGSVTDRQPDVRLSVDGTASGDSLTFAHDLADPATGAVTIVATWSGGDSAIAAVD